MKGLLTYRTIQFSKSRECFHSKSASRSGDKKSPEPVVISNSASESLVNALSALTVCASTVNDLLFVFLTVELSDPDFLDRKFGAGQVSLDFFCAKRLENV